MKNEENRFPINYYLTALFVIAAVTMGALDIPYYGWFIFAAFLSADLQTINKKTTMKTTMGRNMKNNMRYLLGGLFLILGLIILIFGNLFVLITTISDLLFNINNLTYWEITKDLTLLFFREVITGAVALGSLFFSYWIIEY